FRRRCRGKPEASRPATSEARPQGPSTWHDAPAALPALAAARRPAVRWLAARRRPSRPRRRSTRAISSFPCPSLGRTLVRFGHSHRESARRQRGRRMSDSCPSIGQLRPLQHEDRPRHAQIRPAIACPEGDRMVFVATRRHSFAFVSNASANVDFDLRLIHNAALVAVGEKYNACTEALADRRSLDINRGGPCRIGASAGAKSTETARPARWPDRAACHARCASCDGPAAGSRATSPWIAGAAFRPRQSPSAQFWWPSLSRPYGVGGRTLASRDAQWPLWLLVGCRRRLVFLSAADGGAADLCLRCRGDG